MAGTAGRISRSRPCSASASMARRPVTSVAAGGSTPAAASGAKPAKSSGAAGPHTARTSSVPGGAAASSRSSTARSSPVTRGSPTPPSMCRCPVPSSGTSAGKRASSRGAAVPMRTYGGSAGSSPSSRAAVRKFQSAPAQPGASSCAAARSRAARSRCRCRSAGAGRWRRGRPPRRRRWRWPAGAGRRRERFEPSDLALCHLLRCRWCASRTVSQPVRGIRDAPPVRSRYSDGAEGTAARHWVRAGMPITSREWNLCRLPPVPRSPGFRRNAPRTTPSARPCRCRHRHRGRDGSAGPSASWRLWWPCSASPVRSPRTSSMTAPPPRTGVRPMWPYTTISGHFWSTETTYGRASSSAPGVPRD